MQVFKFMISKVYAEFKHFSEVWFFFLSLQHKFHQEILFKSYINEVASIFPVAKPAFLCRVLNSFWEEVGASSPHGNL